MCRRQCAAQRRHALTERLAQPQGMVMSPMKAARGGVETLRQETRRRRRCRRHQSLRETGRSLRPWWTRAALKAVRGQAQGLVGPRSASQYPRRGPAVRLWTAWRCLSRRETCLQTLYGPSAAWRQMRSCGFGTLWPCCLETLTRWTSRARTAPLCKRMLPFISFCTAGLLRQTAHTLGTGCRLSCPGYSRRWGKARALLRANSGATSCCAAFLLPMFRRAHSCLSGCWTASCRTWPPCCCELTLPWHTQPCACAGPLWVRTSLVRPCFTPAWLRCACSAFAACLSAQFASPRPAACLALLLLEARVRMPAAASAPRRCAA